MATPPPGPAQLAAWLRGRWTVQRTINGEAGHFAGTAEFTPAGDAPNVTRWVEHGDLTLGAYTGPARRALTLHADADGLEVRFDDGRPFHDLDLRDGHWEPTHLCGPDTYRGTFDLSGEDHFSVTWRVSGPGRDDTIVSDYRRAQAPARAA
jgi:hypothetical protein